MKQEDKTYLLEDHYFYPIILEFLDIKTTQIKKTYLYEMYILPFVRSIVNQEAFNYKLKDDTSDAVQHCISRLDRLNSERIKKSETDYYIATFVSIIARGQILQIITKAKKYV